jgi:hypothetical protein
MSPNTSLHIAVQNGNVEIIKMLLADGCPSIHVRNAEGQTPLDLATAMNNEEIVRLLLEHGAGHPPQSPQLDFASPATFDVAQRKKRITFWTMLFVIATGLSAFTGIIHGLITIAILTAGHSPVNLESITTVVDGIFMVFFHLPLLVAYMFFYFFYVFRLWEEVPRQFARTTPGLAAGLSLIPFFGWYWMFVALGGLYRDMNKMLEAYGHGRRFSTTLVIVACVIWLVDGIGTIMFGLIMGTVSAFDPVSPFVIFSHFLFCVNYFLWGIFTIVICWIINRNVREFMDIKASLEQ